MRANAIAALLERLSFVLSSAPFGRHLTHGRHLRGVDAMAGLRSRDRYRRYRACLASHGAKAVSTRVPPAFPPDTAPELTPQEVFTDIYRRARWGRNAQGEGHSGSGSTLRATQIYRLFLQQFLMDNDIRSVVDAGCGDWEFSRTLDWDGIDYKGFDIVEANIARNRERFARPNIQFFAANFVERDLPPADLLICKHVLQHLPTGDVLAFLRQLTKYRHILLTNAVDPKTLSAENGDIAVGAGRRLDPTAPPFNLSGRKVLTYWDGRHMHQVLHVGAGTRGKLPNSPVGGVSRFTEAAARVRLESHGFLDVTKLRQDDHGIWIGKALRAGRAVDVVLDVQGRIFFRIA